jgi:gliding motility-associated-like protein
VKWDTAGIKQLTLQVFENMCPSNPVQLSIEVKPTPRAVISSPAELCSYDSLRVQYNASPLPGQQYAWTFDGATPPSGTDPGPFLLHWTTPGPKRIFLEVTADGCNDTTSRLVQVRPAPVADIVNEPRALCLGDRIFLEATGGVGYTWMPKDRLRYEPDGRMFVVITQPSTFSVIARNEYNCVDSDAITFDRIEPCCNFSYPNAFSPNGDGRNDKFRVLMYGNEQSYELSIFDRWGQRVFYTFDPKAGWDGTANGKPCEVGTYFYHLRARCLTGRDEDYKGDVILIR